MAIEGHRPNPERRPRLAVVVSHPIQYFSPWFDEIARREVIDLEAIYNTTRGADAYHDARFGRDLRWDIPLLSGHSYTVLHSHAGQSRGRTESSIAEELSRIRPSAIMVFGYAHRTMWQAVSWAKKAGISVMLFSDSNAQSPRSPARRLAKAPFVRWFYSRVDGALCVSENNRGYHSYYGIPDNRLFASHMPVQRSRFHLTGEKRARVRSEVRRAHGIAESDFVIGASGKFIKLKGLGDLIEASRVAKHSGTDVCLLLIGEGPEREALQLQASEKGVRCVLTGFVNQTAMPSYLAALDVLAAPSQYEAYSLAVAEGVAAGLPVIVSDRVGCAGDHDVARSGQNAIVFPYGDTRSLAGAIARLSRDWRLTDSMARRSSQIGRSFDLDVVSRDLEKAVLALLSMGKR